MIVGGLASAAVGAEFIEPAISGRPPGPTFTYGQLLMAAFAGIVGACIGRFVGNRLQTPKSLQGP
jgi:hypothetical protein